MSTNPKKRSHVQIIMDHMRDKGSISFLEAFGVYRIFNLKGRIADLRGRGEVIYTTMKTDETGKKYAEYSLMKPKAVAA